MKLPFDMSLLLSSRFGCGHPTRAVLASYVRQVLFLLFGSSAAGKSFALGELHGRVTDLVEWIDDERALLRSGAHTLAGWSPDEQSTEQQLE